MPVHGADRLYIGDQLIVGGECWPTWIVYLNEDQSINRLSDLNLRIANPNITTTSDWRYVTSAYYYAQLLDKKIVWFDAKVKSSLYRNSWVDIVITDELPNSWQWSGLNCRVANWVYDGWYWPTIFDCNWQRNHWSTTWERVTRTVRKDSTWFQVDAVWSWWTYSFHSNCIFDPVYIWVWWWNWWSWTIWWIKSLTLYVE